MEQITSYKEIRESKLKEIIERLINSKELTAEQLKLMAEFDKHSIRQGLQLATRKSHLERLKVFLMDFKVDPKQAKDKDIDNYLKYLGQGKFKQSTIRTKKIFMFMFFEWLFKKDKAEIDLIKDLKLGKEQEIIKLPEEMLKPDEIKKLVQVADNFRDKALVILLYETASRKGEFLQLKIKHIDITNDKYGMVNLPQGKTTSRLLPVIFSTPHLRELLESHPNREDKDSPLFVTQGSHLNKALGEDGLKLILKKLAKRAKIKKKVYPHLLRHSRLTELAKELKEQELKVFAGWVGDSRMAKVYCHLSGEDITNKLLSNAGLIDSEIIQKEKNVLINIICPRCKKVLSAETKYCTCGCVLDIKEANKTIDQESKDTSQLRQEMNNMKQDIIKAVTEDLRNVWQVFRVGKG